MAFRKANVLFDLEHQLEGVDVEFRDGGVQPYQQATEVVLAENGSELSIYVGAFAGWRNVHRIDVTWLDIGKEQVFEVKRAKRIPVIDGELATYPV